MAEEMVARERARVVAIMATCIILVCFWCGWVGFECVCVRVDMWIIEDFVCTRDLITAVLEVCMIYSTNVVGLMTKEIGRYVLEI